VAGVPGTGKTVTLHEVMRQVRAKATAGDTGPFRYVEINALRLASPQHAYVQLYRVSHRFLPCAQAHHDCLGSQCVAPKPLRHSHILLYM
jgi:Cdc6-like AAA superfamily ATPase